MTTVKPEFPRPSVGDELVMVEPGSRYREERITRVRVKAVARFKVTLEGLEGEDLRSYDREFDLRDRRPWATAAERRYARQGVPMLHTLETLKWEDRARAADTYLRESGVYTFDIKGTLRKAQSADPVGFANALRLFEGLEEI